MKISITWYGTVACHIVINEKFGLFLGPSLERPENAEPKIKADPNTMEIDPFDLIFISHSHFDHIYNLPIFIKRFKSVHAYGPAVTLENCKNLCSGETFEDYKYEVPDEDWERIHTVTAGDELEFQSKDKSIQLKATAIKSKHVVFDGGAIRQALNKELRKNVGYYLKFLTKFPAKEVIGWNFEITAENESKTIVFFGSLCKKFPEILDEFKGCDYFLIPLHGRKKMLPHGIGMTEALMPKNVIPVHNDNFYPPITWFPDISNYKEWLNDTHPEIKLIDLEPEKTIQI